MSENKTQASRLRSLALKQRSDEQAVTLAPLISEAVESGAANAPQIADFLTRNGIRTPNGARIWNDRHIYAILKRLKRIAETQDAGAGL